MTKKNSGSTSKPTPKNSEESRPSQVSIMGIKFEVKHPVKVDPENSYGETVGEDRVMRIRRSLTGEIYEATLLHETMHAILYAAGIAEVLADNHEEAIVVALENGLSQLYQRKSLTQTPACGKIGTETEETD